MKLAETLRPSRWFAKDRRGVALVTVLTVMALTTILVLTFFSLATSEHRASNTYSHGLQAQQVAEVAVNLVIAQIREATTVGTETAWSSQPGSIRQWDNGGNESFAYKLYSDDQMKTLNWEEFQSDFMDLEGWSSRPDHFVDLNEPVIRGQKVYYPIVHPAASTIPDWPSPLGRDRNGVEGFSYNEISGRALKDSGPLGEKAAAVAKAEGHVAMPVKWIYQLADGTLGVLSESPSGGAGGAAYAFNPISGAGTASDLNPIVARFAFWADDETTKLNINTHAGGLAWDIPKAGGELDMNMGAYQPAQHEWQRYPGHPATVHLSPALAPGVLDIVNDRDAMEMLFKVVPRIVGGGSESGTRKIDTRRKEEENGLVADKDPLFPTIDDVIMRSDREPHEFPDAKGRPIPADQLSEYLERSKFFITANSRTPETNMFNLPRVAIWPIYNADYQDGKYQTHLTPFDRLIHYCASMGSQSAGGYPRYEYIFKRENADSATYDYESIQRNRELYNYLRDLMERAVPGYGDSFSTKYPGEEYQQILTQIFDYIRTTNLHDDSMFEDFQQAFSDNNVEDNRTYTNPRDNANPQIGHKGHGQVVPIRIANTKGMGRFYSLSSVQVHVISCAEPGDLPLPKYFGATSYRNRKNQAASNTGSPGQSLYMNFPPHPFGFERGKPDYDANEPQWLRELRESNATLYEAAMDPANWNWQLAYLDPVYASYVVNVSPSVYKFSRKALDMAAFREGRTRLLPTEQLVQAGLYFNLFSPSIGWGSINPDMEIKIEVLNNSTNNFMYFDALDLPPLPSFSAGRAQFLGFVSGVAGNLNKDVWVFSTNRSDSAWGARRYGGLMPYEYTLFAHQDFVKRTRRAVVMDQDYSTWQSGNYQNSIYDLYPGVDGSRQEYPQAGAYDMAYYGGRSRLTPLDRGYDKISTYSGLNSTNAQSYRYDLVTIPFKINGAQVENGRFLPGEVNFKGGDLKFSFYHGGARAERAFPIGGAASSGVDSGELIQDVTVEIPSFSIGTVANNSTEVGPYPTHPTLMYPGLTEIYREHLGGNFNEFDAWDSDSFSLLERNSLGADPGNPYNLETASTVGAYRKLSTKERPTAGVRAVPTGRFAHINIYSRATLFSPTDIVQSVELRHGDARISAGRPSVDKGELFAPHRLYGKSPLAHSVTTATGSPYYGAKMDKEYLIIPTLPGTVSANAGPYRGRIPLPFGVMKSSEVQLYGDFDNGSGLMIDGPYINKPDEGNIHSLKGKWKQDFNDFWESRRNYGEFPYFNRDDIQESGGPAYFSPNRLVSGPGMFGSLPTGVLTDEPWRTLLFRPAMETGSVKGFLPHPGANSPPDHLIMDLFWMPVVEPYAISEPLSTAGKINLNYDIVPFLHVQRSTALRGVFRSEYMVCIPNQWHQDYKHDYGRGRGYHWRDNPLGGALQGKRLRSLIREDETLDQFIDRFENGRKIFKSSTEICEIHLIPEEVSSRMNTPRGSVGSRTPTEAEMDNGSYWKDHALVGDNSRERPYTNIQARVTTKSNTFLVHYRAQVLKQARRDNPNEYGSWNPTTDTVQAEYRGSSLVERYVNPDADDIPDFAQGSIDGLDAFYRFRVVNPRRFAP